MSSKEIIQNALKLSPQEKLLIVDSILQSLDEPDKNLETIWAEESEKRLKAFREGKIKGIPYDEIEQDFILILAVAHHHRKPFYWLDESK